MNQEQKKEAVRWISVSEYVDDLSIEQLRGAKKLIDEKLEEFEKGGKVAIYIVTDGFFNKAAYLEEDFELAKKKLAEIVLSDETTIKRTNINSPSLERKKVYLSEVNAWLALNDQDYQRG